MILLIDNYDSFTYNVARYFREIGQQVKVVKNDQITLDEVETLAPSHLVVSPGPCTPDQAGVSVPAINAFMGKIPILGVCLGHQCIAQALGGRVVRASTIVHGKTSVVHHDGQGVFAGLPSPFTATRYHSLVVDPSSLPAALEPTAWVMNQAGEPECMMGLKHKEYLVEGVQFHPESVLSEHGHALLKNFTDQTY